MKVIVVKVSPAPKEKIAKGDGRYFVHTKDFGYNYRGAVPQWVVNDVRLGHYYFKAYSGHERPTFIEKHKPNSW